MKSTITWFLKGVVIGIANIIPGVSGGTMALVLGIYDRLIRAIGRLGRRFVVDLLRLPWGAERSRRCREFCIHHDLPFLAVLGVGALTAVVAASRLMKHLLAEHREPTYGFFFGLVAMSIVVPWSLLSRKSWREFASLGLAAALTIALSWTMDPPAPADAAPPVAGGGHTATELLFFLVVGAVAISAMILPGISGSFVLLLLGAYFDVLEAVNERDFAILGAFAVGCLLGLISFARLLEFLLARCRSLTMAFLIGLMIGSLWGLWPFKSAGSLRPGEKAVYLENVWPTAVSISEVTTIAAAMFGALLVAAFYVVERRRSRAHR